MSPKPNATPIIAPPPSLEAEQAVLGGLMLDNAKWDEVMGQMNEAQFFDSRHRVIFRTFHALADQGKPFDIVTAAEWLEERHLLEEAGGWAYLGVLARDTPSAANVKAYAGITGNRADQRQLIQIAQDLQRHAENPKGQDLDALIDEYAEQLHGLKEHRAQQGRGSTAREPAVNLIKGSCIMPRNIDWLWKYWLARGKLHLLAGLPGVCKSTVSLAMAATVTRGGRWPDGSQAEKGRVLVWSSEDDREDTIVPRLIANGADLDMIDFVDTVGTGRNKRPFDPATDMPLLEKAVTPEHKLCLIDSIADAVSGDSHKNSEVRRALFPLTELAREKRIAILGIAHFTKQVDGPMMLKIVGSVAFNGLARLSMVAFQHPDHGRLLMRGKSNIGPDEGGFAYAIRQDPLDCDPSIEASHVLWGDYIPGKPDDIVAAAIASKRPATDDAEDFLKQLLTSGPVAAQTIEERATEKGHSMRTLKRIKKELGIESRRRDGLWFWGFDFEPFEYRMEEDSPIES